MKDIIKQLCLLLFLCLLSVSGKAAHALAPDSAAAAQEPLVVRLPDSAKLEAMRADKDFQYHEEVRQGETLWQRIKARLARWLRKIFYADEASSFWEYFIYALLVATIVFVFVKMRKVGITGLFGRKADTVHVPYDVLEENIHELDLGALIEEAIAQHQLRKAIRLHYLQSLKKLTDAKLINWEPGKTNRSYISEIKHPVLRQEFEQLTSMFEYVWYGGAALGSEHFEVAQQEFIQFNHLLKQHT